MLHFMKYFPGIIILVILIVLIFLTLKKKKAKKLEKAKTAAVLAPPKREFRRVFFKLEL